MRGRLLLVAAALLFSTAGAAVKACTLSAWQVVAFRSIVATLALLVFVRSTRARWSWRSVLVGAAGGATMTLFVSSTKRTTAASAIFLQSTAPLWVLVFAPIVLGESVRRADLLYLVAVGAGLATILLGGAEPLRTAPDPALGNLLGVTAGLTWGLALIGFRWLARERTVATTPLVVANVLAALVCLPLALPVVSSTATDWAVIAFLGIVQVALAYVCFAAGMREVPALEASLLMLLEPALSPVWAWLVQGERPDGATLSGGAIVLVATAARARYHAAMDGARAGD